MSAYSATYIRTLVEQVLAELDLGEVKTEPGSTTPDHGHDATTQPTDQARYSKQSPAHSPSATSITQDAINVSDPTTSEMRHRSRVQHPHNGAGLDNLVASTNARIGVGRAGPRPRTSELLLFQADHAVTQDAIFGDVPTDLLDQFGLFIVQSQAANEEEYLLRPDLGRLLSTGSKTTIEDRCIKSPQVQIVVGDGLSAAAVTNNLDKIYPVLNQGLSSAGLSLGTPFFVQRCRVGIMNDINSVIGADVIVLIIGERPGLGVADALSVYSGWRPAPGKTDAHRDVVCMITDHGGTNPLEAGAYVVDHVLDVISQQVSGVELRLHRSDESSR